MIQGNPKSCAVRLWVGCEVSLPWHALLSLHGVYGPRRGLWEGAPSGAERQDLREGVLAHAGTRMCSDGRLQAS